MPGRVATHESRIERVAEVVRDEFSLLTDSAVKALARRITDRPDPEALVHQFSQDNVYRLGEALR